MPVISDPPLPRLHGWTNYPEGAARRLHKIETAADYWHALTTEEKTTVAKASGNEPNVEKWFIHMVEKHSGVLLWAVNKIQWLADGGSNAPYTLESLYLAK